MSDDERDLREAFKELRRATLSRTPAFASLRDRAPAPRAEQRRRLALVLASLAVVALLWPRPAPPPPKPAPSIERWKAPTDFLLHTPGAELLRTVPSLGRGVPSLTLADARERRMSP